MNKLHFEITKSAVGAGSVALAASSVYLLLSQSISVAAFAVFCCIIGASVAKSCCTCFSSVLWMPAASVSCCYGAFLTAAWRGSALEYVGGALIGLSCGGFLFVIIPLAVANQFKHCIALASGIIWSLALVFSLLMLLISESSLYTALLTAAVCMLAGSLCIRIKPCNDAVRFFPMPQSRFKAAAASSFVVLISLSAALLSVLCSRNLFFDSEHAYFLIAAGAVSGPLAAGLFADKNGALGGAVLSVFLLESSLMCFSFGSGDFFLSVLCYLTLGLCLTSPLVIVPLLIYYLFGSDVYVTTLSSIFTLFPLGLFAFFLLGFAGESIFSSYALVLSIFFMLLCGFLALFSAWKRRLVLLK